MLSLSLMVKGKETARMRSEKARLKMKMFLADLIFLSLITVRMTRLLLTTKMQLKMFQLTFN